MSKVSSSDTEDSGLGRSSSESNTSESNKKSTDSQNNEYNNIKSINFGNKEFRIKTCDKKSTEKVIVRIENKFYELLSETKFTTIDENSTKINKTQERKNIDNQKYNKEQEPIVEFDKIDSKKILNKVLNNQEAIDKEFQVNMVFDYLKASQREWNRLVHESVNIRLLSIFNKATIEEIAKELKEKMTDEVILLINNETCEISLNDIINHLPKIVSRLIETIMYEYLQVKINEKNNVQIKYDQLAEMKDQVKMQALNVENEKNAKNLNNLNQKLDESQLETSVIEAFENKEKESTEETKLENVTRKSYIARMEIKNMGSSHKRSFFADELFAYMRLRGTPILEVPKYGVTRLDFYLLYRQVIARGGYTEVTENNLWKNVLATLGTPCKSISALKQLKQLYEQYLYPYECEKKSPTILQNIIEKTIKRPNFKEIIFQSYDQAYNTKSEKSLNTRTNPSVLTDQMSKTLLNQYKKPLSLSFKEKENKVNENTESEKKLTKDQPSLESKSETDESKLKLSSSLVNPEICSLSETESEKTSTDDCSSETSSEVKLELQLISKSESECELTSEVISEEKQENEWTIRNSKLVKITAIIFALISFFLLIILQSQIIFSKNIDNF